jgi:hypothetical protein
MMTMKEMTDMEIPNKAMKDMAVPNEAVTDTVLQNEAMADMEVLEERGGAVVLTCAPLAQGTKGITAQITIADVTLAMTTAMEPHTVGAEALAMVVTTGAEALAMVVTR